MANLKFVSAVSFLFINSIDCFKGRPAGALAGAVAAKAVPRSGTFVWTDFPITHEQLELVESEMKAWNRLAP